MEKLKPLSDFFRAINTDARITTTHIGIYMALLQYWVESERANPIRAFSHEIMPIAKISSPTTYLKCIRDLNEYGYIRYEPSFKKNVGSAIYFPPMD